MNPDPFILMLINMIGINQAIDTSYRDRTGLTIITTNPDPFILMLINMIGINQTIYTSCRDRIGLKIIYMNPDPLILKRQDRTYNHYYESRSLHFDPRFSMIGMHPVIYTSETGQDLRSLL